MDVKLELSKILKVQPEEVKFDSVKFNFNPYNSTWYKKNFPGFDDEVYRILERASNEDNKVIDMTDNVVQSSNP
jgi:hypothetical protein